jgi:hypothetical protein
MKINTITNNHRHPQQGYLPTTFFFIPLFNTFSYTSPINNKFPFNSSSVLPSPHANP